MLGGVHKVDNVVGMLEVEATTPPTRLVSVKYFPSKLRKNVGNQDWCCLKTKSNLIGTTVGAMKCASLAKKTPFLSPSSSSVVAGSSSMMHSSIHCFAS